MHKFKCCFFLDSLIKLLLKFELMHLNFFYSNILSLFLIYFINLRVNISVMLFMRNQYEVKFYNTYWKMQRISEYCKKLIEIFKELKEICTRNFIIMLGTIGNFARL